MRMTLVRYRAVLGEVLKVDVGNTIMIAPQQARDLCDQGRVEHAALDD